MEDVLDLYLQDYDPLRPVVCLDEMPVGLISNARAGLPMKPGRCAKEDYEYVRHGGASVFGALDLKGGIRFLEVKPSRTSIDFAHFLKRMLDEIFPHAEVVRLVLDNLNTHTKASLYLAFPPEEARRLGKRIELHYTPKHGSWLNAIELEFAALKKQCVGVRIGSIQVLAKTIAAWQEERNSRRQGVRWTFDTNTARDTMKRVYPTVED